MSAETGRKTGGYRKNSGHGKCGYYKGYWCHSSWELAFVIYCLEHNIKIERNSEKYQYVYENKTYNYYPDFIVNNELVEIKGYWTPKEEEKIKQCTKKITVIDKNNIMMYINYVINKYGKDYISLYDNMEQ